MTRLAEGFASVLCYHEIETGRALHPSNIEERTPMPSRLAWSCLLAVWIVVSGPTTGAEVHFRKPEALLLVDDGARLLTANRASGTVSIVDVAEPAGRRRGRRSARGWPTSRSFREDVGCWPSIKRPASSAARAPGRRDPPRSATPVAADPARVVVGADGLHAVVVSRWSRTLTFLAWDRPDSPDAGRRRFAWRRRLRCRSARSTRLSSRGILARAPDRRRRLRRPARPGRSR